MLVAAVHLRDEKDVMVSSSLSPSMTDPMIVVGAEEKSLGDGLCHYCSWDTDSREGSIVHRK